MATLTLPSKIIAQSATWRLQSNTQSFTSPLSRSVQTLENPGARWVADLSFPPLRRDDLAAAFRSFLAQLRGESGRFRLYDHSNPSPLGVATGTPLVNDPGASIAVGDNTIPTDGWTISQTGILLEGTMFMVNDELKILTADADSDGSGNATLQFEPPLRAAPANNAAINLGSSATAVMKLTNDNQAAWSTIDTRLHSFRLSCVESFT